MRYIVALVALCASAAVAVAQESGTPTTPLQAGAAALTPPPTQVQTVEMVSAGTPIQLRTRDHLTTKGKKLSVGHRFNLEVASPIVVNGVTVIPEGSPAVGEITDVRNKGMWGKSGKINARVLWVRANGRQIRLSGQLDDKGTTGTAGVVGAALVAPIAGFFITGTSAEIPAGAVLTAYLDEDLPLSFFKSSPTNPPTNP
jgi:hypothetical protein